MISVIVPIYNAESYLPRALDSILSQTYKEWEAILVDDGSTDGSSRIADEYAARDHRFTVIHQPNGGLSDARNTGLEHISGEYLVFLDADDFLHLGDPTPHFKYYKQPPYLVTDNIYDYATEYSSPKDIDKRWAVKHCQVWRCMYKTYAIRGIKFIKGINYEDFPWWSEVLLHIHRCTILNLPLYFYYPNPLSYILSANQSHKIDSLRKGIEAAKQVYATAPEAKRNAWKRNFLFPFEQKLRKKEST